MTVNTTNITSGPFVGNDIADEFSYAFRVEDKTQLKVIETDLLGVQTVLTVDTDYTVAGIGVDAGGLVTRVAGPLPTDFTWFIRSDYKQTQLTAFSSQGAFFPDLHEAAIDQLTFLIQQLQDGEDRTFKLSDTIDIDGVFTIVQDAAARAGLFLGFDTNGDLAASLGGFLSQPEQDIRFGLKTATVASLKLLSLPSGATVSTGGYYDGWAAFLEPQGAGEYNTATLAEVRTAKSDGAWVPDEWVNHTLANGTIAMLNLDGPLNAMKAGVVADNVTDDLAAFKAALAESDVLDCTGLTIRLEVVDVTVFTVSGKEIIGGAIDVIVPDTSFRLIFSADNFTLNGCTFTHSIPVGGQVAFVRPTGDNVFITGNCNIDGGVFDNTGAESHSFFLIQAEGTGTQRRCIAEDSIISNVSFCHLKTNTTTSTQLGWKFNRNTVSGVFVEGAGLNSPVGVVEDFEIVGNTFLTHFGTLTGAFGLYIACATGRDIKITGNSFYGVVDQCIHLEEGIKDFVISGNTGNVDAKAGAIALLENNVAGPTVFPSEGIISKNTIRKAGTLRESGSIGISLIANGSADSPASDISITDNIMTGFERDYYLDADVDDTSLVTGNVANDATDGFFITLSLIHI